MKFEGLHTAKVVTLMLLVYGLVLSLSACKGGGAKNGSDANTEKASADDGQSKRSIGHAGNNAGSSQNVAPYDCGNILHGENEFRQFYSTSTVYQGQSCDDYKITLFRKCDNGVLGQWQGANRYASTQCVLAC